MKYIKECEEPYHFNIRVQYCAWRAGANIVTMVRESCWSVHFAKRMMETVLSHRNAEQPPFWQGQLSGVIWFSAGWHTALIRFHWHTFITKQGSAAPRAHPPRVIYEFFPYLFICPWEYSHIQVSTHSSSTSPFILAQRWEKKNQT